MRWSLLCLMASLLVATPGCTREEKEPLDPAVSTLVADALNAAARIRVSGDRNAAATGRHAPAYLTAMSEQFDQALAAHRDVIRTGSRYRRHQVDLQILDHCTRGDAVNVVARAFVRFDIEGPAGSPPFSAWEEEHVFRFSVDGGPRMIDHHEITLAERKNREAYRRLRQVCSD